MIDLNSMRQEEPAVQITDLPQQSATLGATLFGGAGEAPEEKERQEAAVEEIGPFLTARVELAAQIATISAIQETLLLEEVDEHQPVEQDGGVPAAVPLAIDPFDAAQEELVLFLEFVVEALGHPLHVERFPQAGGNLG